MSRIEVPTGDTIDPEVRRILDAVSDAWVVLDAGWHIVYLNPVTARINNKTVETFLGQTLWDAWPDTVGSEFERHYRQALAEQRPIHFEQKYAISGQELWFEIDAYPYRSGLAIVSREVTSRKRTERALRESEARYRATFDNAAVGIAHLDMQGRWLRFNEAVCRITGYTREELERLTFAEITHPGDVAADWALARRLATGEIPNYSLEKRYIRKDGSIVWIGLTVSLLRGASGPGEYISVIEDITERKRAEAAVHEREERLYTVLESITDGLMVLDRDFRYSYVNTAWERMCGLRLAEVLGRTNWEVFPGSVGTTIESEFRRAARDRVPVEFESFYQPWQRWFANRVYPTAEGGISVYARDITEEKLTREALRKSEQRYRSLVQATTVVVWTADTNGDIVEPQPAWELFTGQHWDEYAGTGWIAAIHSDDRARVLECWREAIASRSHFETECRAWHAPAGEWRHCAARAVPVSGDNAEVQEWIGAVSDIHERRLLEATLRHDDKVESLGVLAGGVAHDFNNLLVGIMGNASLIAEDGPPLLRSTAEEIIRACRRASDLTRQMLAYAGKGQRVLESVDVSGEVREVSNLVRSSLGPATRLHLELNENLPALRADRAQIQQIVMNLIINAGEALDSGGGRIRISTAPVQFPRPGVMLTVEDNGRGMTPEIKARIFDPFFTTKFTGRGLGLAAVMGSIRAHQGTIDVDSTPGHGSTFRVFLPALQVVEAPGPLETAHPAPPPAGATVLVIDDEEVILNVARKALERKGVRVVSAASGREALRILDRLAGEIDVVVLDATMPDIGGRDVLRVIRRYRPDVPVIVSSGHSAAEIEQYFAEDPPAGLLPKPYTPAALTAAVAAHAGRPQKLRKAEA